MIVYPGEVGICSEQLYAWMPPQQVPGILYLTNSRLVFEAALAFQPADPIEQALGLVPAAPPPLLNLDLRLITNVTVIPGETGWHVLRVEASGGTSVYQFQTPQAQNWLASIQGARGGGVPLLSGPTVLPAGSPSPATNPTVVGSAPPPSAAPRSSSASPPQTSVTAPAPASTGGGTVWCMRCGKSNPAGGTKCASCGAALG
jgi:hypothetical protein